MSKFKEDLESLANPDKHSADLGKVIFYHPKYPKADVDYEEIFTHIGSCNFCNERIKKERQRNPLYHGYVQAVEEGRVKEYWDAVRDTIQGLKK